MNHSEILTAVGETTKPFSEKVIPPVQVPVSEPESVTISSVYEIKEKADIKERLTAFLRQKAVLCTAILFFAIVGGISAFSMVYSVPAVVVGNQETTLFFHTPTEIPTQIAVASTKETLTFKKNSYKVELGKKITVECKYTAKDGKEKKEMTGLIYVSGNTEVVLIDKKGNVTGKRCGTTNITAISETGIYTTVPVTVTVPKSYKIKYVPYIYQGEKYPSGCESVSTVMLLQYMGFKISVEDFIDKYLPKGEFSFNKKGEMCGADPYTAFLGNPYTEEALGCYPSVIKKAVDKYFAEKNKTENYRAVDLTGVSVNYLAERYITNNQPVVIWATMFMANPVVTEQWIVKGADKNSPYKDGDNFEWKANEHCMLLVGYDENYYYLHDPLSEKETAYDKATFEDRFCGMGRFALIIDKL